MHFVLSWDIKDRSRYNEIENELKGKIKPFSWVRPFNSLYIINVPSQAEWQSTVDNLTEICKKYPNKIDFIVSPLMGEARYDGYLDAKLWEAINERSI